MNVILRQWRDSDLAPFVALNSDPEVMRYFPAALTAEQCHAFLQRQRELIATRGWGLWAVEADGAFAGFTGLSVPTFEAPFMPCVEVGWRLAREFWGRSIGYQAAQQALEYGFGPLGLAEVVSFTAEVNHRSRRLMERLGLEHDRAGDFLHPRIPETHELCRHVLYRRSGGAAVKRNLE